MRNHILTAAAVLALAAAYFSRPAAVAQQAPAVQRWEYQTFKYDVIDLDTFNTKLKQFGVDGWEAIATGSISPDGSGRFVLFKRPLR